MEQSAPQRHYLCGCVLVVKWRPTLATIRGRVDVDQQSNALVSKHHRQQACRLVLRCATHLSIILECPDLVGRHEVADKN